MMMSIEAGYLGKRCFKFCVSCDIPRGQLAETPVAAVLFFCIFPAVVSQVWHVQHADHNAQRPLAAWQLHAARDRQSTECHRAGQVLTRQGCRCVVSKLHAAHSNVTDTVDAATAAAAAAQHHAEGGHRLSSI